MQSDKPISIKHASELLEVNVATVRNWIRYGYLSLAAEAKNQLHEKEVLFLKSRIAQGEIERLRKRANKKKTCNFFIPAEYISDSAFIGELESIRSIFFSRQCDLELTLFVLAMKQLVLNNELVFDAASDILALDSFSQWKRQAVKKEIYAWRSELKIADKLLEVQAYRDMFDILKNVSHEDTLGIIYQSLMNEGGKSQQGSYYTPRELIDDIFKDLMSTNGCFLDPCCGTGQFLIRAARNGHTDPLSLYGFDLDMLSVRIARVNILLIFADEDFTPHICQRNTLTEPADSTMFRGSNERGNIFRLIATNPPWGASYQHDTSMALRALYPMISSGESFSYFFIKSLALAEPGGHLSFVLPESILNIKTHSDIRYYILNNTTILSIHCLGKRFKGVFTPVIRLDILIAPPVEPEDVVIRLENKTHKVPQQRFLTNRHYVFDIYLTEEENRLIKQLYSLPHTTLAGKGEWALGIVTGNNESFLSATCLPGMEPVFRGADINSYTLSVPTVYIKFEPEKFQQVAQVHKYRAKEKLIYKFISKRLVFAYDDKQYLTLNSANILIPRIHGYPMKLVLGLFNSSLYQFLFAKKFSTHKVLRGDLEALPLPLFPAATQASILKLVDQALVGRDVQKELDQLIMASCGVRPRVISG